MKVVRLVKNSDFKSVEHLVKHSGKGMTTMPKHQKRLKKELYGQKNLEIKKQRNQTKIVICLCLRTMVAL